jgi:MYXO-CTERM domain-containing protein
MKFAVASIVALVVAGAAQATPITQTFTMPVTATDISGSLGTGTFNYFQSAGAPMGAILTSVELRIQVQENLRALSVTNNDPNNQQTFRYVTYSNIFVVGSAPAADKTLLKTAINTNGGMLGNIDLYDTGNVAFNAGQTIIYAPPVVNVSDDSMLVPAANIALYDTTGTFTLGFTTQTFQSFIGGGGNGSNMQDTDANAVVQVIYNYREVPAPGSAALIGLGGLVAIRRRRA